MAAIMNPNPTIKPRPTYPRPGGYQNQMQMMMQMMMMMMKMMMSQFGGGGGYSPYGQSPFGQPGGQGQPSPFTFYGGSVGGNYLA